MIFTLICFGKDRIYDSLHLLNDLRNINAKVYFLTDQDLDLNYYQFDNIKMIKTTNDFNDFERYKIIKLAFLDNPDTKYIYHLDCDSRLFDFRKEKFNQNKFTKLLDKKDFDIMCPWFLEPIKTHLEKPDINENKEVRNFKYGFDELINYFKKNCRDFEEIVNHGIPLETSLIFRRSEKLMSFFDSMFEVEKIILYEEEKINRKIKITGSGFVIGLMGDVYNLKIISDEIIYHFFKGNFIKEVFPFNFIMDKNKKIFFDE